MIKTAIDKERGFFVDQNCKFSIQGKEFESGGAWMTKIKAQKAKDETFIGMVYADDATGTVTNWHGTIKIPARFGKVWVSNFGDRRRAVRFQWQGVEMFGVWCSCDSNMAVKVRQVKGGHR